MKQAKAIVITVIVTLLTLGTVLYTSCRKDHCKNTICQHGSACSDGFCICASGYTGTYCEVQNISNIGFKNNTYSKVTLTINNVDYIIDTGHTLVMTGGYGDTLRGTAKVHGAYGVNVNLAPIKVSYPVRGTTIQNLDVSPVYFFLKVVNSNATVPLITQVHVNYQQTDETLDIVGIPNDGQSHWIGYYKAHSTTRIRLEHTPTFVDFTDPAVLGDTALVNKSYTALFN